MSALDEFMVSSKTMWKDVEGNLFGYNPETEEFFYNGCLSKAYQAVPLKARCRIKTKNGRKETAKKVVVDKIDGYSKGNCYFSQRGHEAHWEVGVGLRVREVIRLNVFEDAYYQEGDYYFEEAINRYVLSEIEESLVKDFLNSEEEILYVDLSEWVHEPEVN